MADKVTVHIRELEKSWQYDFKARGHKRQRKGGFKTPQQAMRAGRRRVGDLNNVEVDLTLEEAYVEYMSSKRSMKDSARDTYEHHWTRIGPILGNTLIRDITARKLDKLVRELPSHLAMRTVNHHLTLVRAILRHMWRREVLTHLPYVPMGEVEETDPDWYTEQERDRFLAGVFRKYPKWYLFFYLTCRLGLRRGEAYAVSLSRVRRDPALLIVDRQIQRGTKNRPAKITSRKNRKSFTMQLPPDVLNAIDWHVDRGYSGEDFLFSKDGKFPTWLDSHQRPMRNVQKELGLRRVGHHVVGRHSVGSQAATEGESLKSIQAQLGHRSPDSTNRYMHLGSKAQLHVVKTLAPAAPEHEKIDTPCQPRVNEDLSNIG